MCLVKRNDEGVLLWQRKGVCVERFVFLRSVCGRSQEVAGATGACSLPWLFAKRAQ